MKRGMWLSIGGALGITTLIGVGYFTMRKDSETQHLCEFTPALRERAKDRVLYCPNPAQLPAGVISKIRDATYGEGAVIYPITDDKSTIVVSLQAKPDPKQLAHFVPNVIPLHFDVDTPVGKAQTGVSNGRSTTSLPTTSSTWIILTAPSDYSVDRLTEILKAFQAD